MRIDTLTLCNINALRGRWHIDFTALAGSGIFAITGPTGAGKSTILDALCLALYGQTPRLGKITQSHNALMTRHSGECSAEIVISVDGKRYRIYWGQKRAHGKADGKLQNPRHEIADADSGAIIEDKTSRTVQRVEALTGLNFERFVRAVLLAQGQFAAFLHAGGDERAPILEQITGTAIYTRLSIAAHARYQEARETLQQLQGDSPAPPDADAIAQLHNALHNAERQVADAKAARDKSAAQLAQWQQWHTQQTQCTQWQNALADAETAWQALADTRDALQRHQRSQSGAAAYRDWQREHAAYADLGAKIAHNHAQKTALQTALHTHEHNAAHAAAQAQAARHAEQAAEPALRQARDLDSSHRHLQSRVQENAARLQTLAFATADTMSALAAQHADKQALDNRYQTLLDGQSPQDWQQALDAARERYAALRDLGKIQETQQALARDIRAAEETLAARQNQLQHAHTAEAQAQQTLEAAEEKTADKRRIYEQALLIRNLDSHRAHLKAGEPCPLCGAREHPYASGAPRPEDDRAALQQAENAEAAAQKNWQHAHSARIQAERDTAHSENTRKQLNARQNEYTHTLAHGIQQWQVTDGDLPAALAACEAHGSALAERIRALHDIQRQREQADNILRARDWQQTRQTLAALEQDIATNRAARHAVLPAADADAHAAALRAAVDTSHAAEQRAAQTLAQQREALGKLDAEIATLATLQSGHAQAAAEKQAAFYAWLPQAGFRDLADWQAAQSHAPHIAQWQQAVEQAALQREQAHTRLADGEQTLARLRATLPDDIDDEQTLRARHENDDAQYSHALQQQGQLLAAQAEHTRRAEQWAKRREQIAAQQRECELWREMHDLIGSADGKKFRNFAQGLTFDIMIAHANQELAKMSDRYLLVRAASGHLELDVIDDYQGGETRTTKNLSGGEQFIVSLALALGLSAMAGEKIRIDSLFLDEGFGTLDEQSLDQALDTLASLPQQGKLIGIISHVGALRERIPAQIRVIPQPGGISRLQGEGVQWLDKER